MEKAKSTGKCVVLSDIPVHREQNPEKGIYSPAFDHEAPADALLLAWSEFDRQVDISREERALAASPARQREFVERYREIVTAAAG